MAKRKQKKTTKKKQKRGSAFQSVANFLAGLALTICMVSIGYGVFARHAGARSIDEPIRVEVLNGTGQAGLANRVAGELRKLGVDVFRVENADHFDYTESILIKRRGSVDAESLAGEIGCDNVVEQLQDDGYVDATLIIGDDFGELRLGIEAESSLPESGN